MSEGLLLASVLLLLTLAIAPAAEAWRSPCAISKPSADDGG
jgi:hypothetical protein